MSTTRSVTHTVLLLSLFLFIATTPIQGVDDQAASSARETELLAVLRSDAAASEKALVCKKLAIDGSHAAVPDLAALLPDPHLSSWARIALEAIPGEAADEALRQAADTLEGRLLIGMINSIGVRRDAKAVDALTSRLRDNDVAVASAAAVALGHIGNAAATESLRKALADAPAGVRSAVAEGCVLCAERLHTEGNSIAATEIYDEVRAADVPLQRIIEATRGAILARDQAGIPLLLETLRSSEKKMFQLALGTIREFPGSDIDQTLAAELVRSDPATAALLIQAMADRPDTVLLPAVLAAAEQGDKQVRLSAIDALRRVGDDSCLAALLQIAVAADADLAQTAQQTLAELPGDQVDAKIVAGLSATNDKVYPVLLQLVGRRRIDAVPDLLQALSHSDESVRSTALISLGQTVSLRRLPVLISQVVAPQHPEDAAVAQQALKAACVRMPDRDACAAELAGAVPRAPGETQIVLLEVISEVGGSTALQTLAAAAKSDDPQLQDAGSRLLGKWNGLDAAPVLMDLAKSAPAEKFQVRALRGYIGLARKFAMPEPQRVKMCRQALETGRTAEQKLVLEVLKLHPSVEALKLAIEAGEVQALKAEAAEAVQVISRKLGDKGIDVKALLTRASI